MFLSTLLCAVVDSLFCTVLLFQGSLQLAHNGAVESAYAVLQHLKSLKSWSSASRSARLEGKAVVCISLSCCPTWEEYV